MLATKMYLKLYFSIAELMQQMQNHGEGCTSPCLKAMRHFLLGIFLPGTRNRKLPAL